MAAWASAESIEATRVHQRRAALQLSTLASDSDDRAATQASSPVQPSSESALGRLDQLPMSLVFEFASDGASRCVEINGDDGKMMDWMERMWLEAARDARTS